MPKSVTATPGNTASWLESQQRLRRMLAAMGTSKVFNKEDGKMYSAAVILLACKHMDFVYVQNAKRILNVRPIFKTPVWQKCYRTCDAAICPPTEEYGVPNLGKTFTGSIRDLFDQVVLDREMPAARNRSGGTRVAMS